MNATDGDRPTTNLSPTALPVMSGLLNPEHQQKTFHKLTNKVLFDNSRSHFIQMFHLNGRSWCGCKDYLPPITFTVMLLDYRSGASESGRWFCGWSCGRNGDRSGCDYLINRVDAGDLQALERGYMGEGFGSYFHCSVGYHSSRI